MVYFKTFCNITFIFLLHAVCAVGQPVDHWETMVNSNVDWNYLVPSSAPDTDWNTPSYDDSGWLSGTGGIGYGDGDDNTVISAAASLYIRHQFTVIDTTDIFSMLLHADYDDGFIAYLNGVEIARSNAGPTGTTLNWDDPSDGLHEAVLYTGGVPEAFYLSSSTTSSLLVNGLNTLAVQIHNESVFSSDMTGLFWLSAGLTIPGPVYDPTPGWFFAPNTTSDLLLLSINTEGIEIPSDTKLNATIGIADGPINDAYGPYDVYEGPVGIEIRGSSSSFFDKKGYGIEFRTATGANRNVAIPGFPADDDFILHGPFSDKSLLRNKLAFWIDRQIQPWSPRTRFCELWINEEYRGLYLLIEKIKVLDERLDLANLRPVDTAGNELTGGYVLAVDRDEGSDHGWWSPYMDAPHYFEFKDPNGPDLQTEQRNYIIDYVTGFENALAGANFLDSATGYAVWADIPSFVDHLIIREIANDVDAYRLSTFLYKDKDSRGGKLKMGPVWDSNLSFGNVDYCDQNLFTNGWAFDADDFCGAPQPFWWDQLLLDSNFLNTWQCRWTSLRETSLTSDKISDAIDSFSLEIQGAATRNFDRWPVLGNYVWPNAFIGATWGEEVGFLKNWVLDRLSWMDLNTPGTCREPEEPTTGIAETGRDILLFPNPAGPVLYTSGPVPLEAVFTVYDVSGRILKSERFTRALSLPSGNQTLIIELRTESKVLKRQLILRAAE